MTLPEWMPKSYLLQVRHSHCCNCGKTHTSSDLWLIETHYLKAGATRRTPAHFIDSRLARGKSERTVQTPTCHECFTEYTPVYVPRPSDLEMLHPGKPVAGNNYAGLSLEDL